jgi:hypothetical protein
MDTSAIEAKIADLQTSIQTEQADIESKQSDLSGLQAELAQANTINAIEALTPDQITAINEALAADGSQISLSLPPATEPSQPVTE